MTLEASYALWNNKGGVGKSTITFHLASRYAERHRNKRVLVIDMCPQANSSMMLMGGGANGENRVMGLCQTAPTPRTVVGYLATVLNAGPGAPLPNPTNFLVTPHANNADIPSNLWLLCGDGNLEPMAPLISDRAAQAALLAGANPWRWVHLTIREFINNVVAGGNEPLMVFVDTNPSFSIYTEIAISAVDRLIVPVNADDASRVATNAMFTLIHGAVPPHPIYGQYTYATKASANTLTKPVVHLVVGNRLTQYGGPAAAFGAMSDATADTLFSAYQTNPTRFSPAPRQLPTMAAFRDYYSIPLRDFNTAGVVSAHRGIPVSRLQTGQHNVYGATVTVDGRRRDECLTAIDQIVDRL